MEEEFMKIERDQTWVSFYQELEKKSRDYPTEVSGQHPNLDRYLNIKPFDRTRVKLKRMSPDYINANLVTVPKAARRYILTQGPLPNTLESFWLMVWEQKSHAIVMLNKIQEAEDYPKCAQYWPSAVNESLSYESAQLKVTLKSVETTKHYIVRSLLLEDEVSCDSRTVTQFHYTVWPDHDQPDSPASLLRLLTAVRKLGALDTMDEPPVVHCSAGIGRSGTFCLIDSILTMVENQGSTESIDISNTLLEMRDYRKGLIQSHIQLKFAYMCIIYGVKILEKANKLHPHISSMNPVQQSHNGGAKTEGKKSRRSRRKNPGSTNSLNVFKKHLLVEAMDDIESDEADSLFYDATKPSPNIKKPRNSSPQDFNVDTLKILSSQTVDSSLLRRRERESQSQRLAEKTREIKDRMKAEELRRERYARLKKSALVGGVVALVLSSIAYIYMYGNSS